MPRQSFNSHTFLRFTGAANPAGAEADAEAGSRPNRAV